MITFRFHDQEVMVPLTEELAQAMVVAIHQSRMRAMTAPVEHKVNGNVQIQVEPGNRVVMVNPRVGMDSYSQQISAVDYGKVTRAANMVGFYGLSKATMIRFRNGRCVAVYADDTEPDEYHLTDEGLIRKYQDHVPLEQVAGDTGLDMERLKKLLDVDTVKAENS